MHNRMGFLDVNAQMGVGNESSGGGNIGEQMFIRCFFLQLIFVDFIVL